MTSPWAVWSAVPDDIRREVGQLAKQGRRHPDPRVASAAQTWAELVLRENRRHPWRSLLVVPFRLAQVVVEGADGDTVVEILERRWARRVLRAR